MSVWIYGWYQTQTRGFPEQRHAFSHCVARSFNKTKILYREQIKIMAGIKTAMHLKTFKVSYLMAGAVEIPAYVIACIGMDRLGRRNTLIPFLISSAVTCALLMLIPQVSDLHRDTYWEIHSTYRILFCSVRGSDPPSDAASQMQFSHEELQVHVGFEWLCHFNWPWKDQNAFSNLVETNRSHFLFLYLPAQLISVLCSLMLLYEGAETLKTGASNIRPGGSMRPVQGS